jgi:lipoate-protein ligase A
MSNVCQLIVDPPAEGAWNMAVDEALLDAVAETGLPTLRFYQWKHPTLSLGYFQRHEDRTSHSSSLQADAVRRLSGGGAILHDRELTYSLILPANHRFAADMQALYQTVHQAIVRTLENMISASEAPWQPVLCNNPSPSARHEEPFLCFERRAPGDILLESKDDLSVAESRKIVGSAQRRRQGAVLQHGSLLLSRSSAAPELPGFCDLTGIQITPELAAENLQLSFATALKVRLEITEISAPVVRYAERMLRQRYGNTSWLERR